MAQAVRRSPPAAGVATRSLHVGFVVDETGVWVGFSRGFSGFPLPQLSFHHFSTLISSILFHFNRPCDGATGVVDRHSCSSRTYNVGLHRTSSLDPTLCWTRVEDISLLYSSTLSVPLMYDDSILNRESEFSIPNSFMYFCCSSWMLQILFIHFQI